MNSTYFNVNLVISLTFNWKKMERFLFSMNLLLTYLEIDQQNVKMIVLISWILRALFIRASDWRKG